MRKMKSIKTFTHNVKINKITKIEIKIEIKSRNLTKSMKLKLVALIYNNKTFNHIKIGVAKVKSHVNLRSFFLILRDKILYTKIVHRYK